MPLKQPTIGETSPKPYC